MGRKLRTNLTGEDKKNIIEKKTGKGDIFWVELNCKGGKGERKIKRSKKLKIGLCCETAKITIRDEGLGVGQNINQKRLTPTKEKWKKGGGGV